MITCRKLKLTIVEPEKEIRKEKYDFIKNEQYQQYRGLNLGMSMLYAHNILEGVGSGAEKRLEAQIGNLEKKVAKCKMDLENATKDSKIESLNKTIDNHLKEMEKLKYEFDEKVSKRLDVDEPFKEMYIKDIYTVLQGQINFLYKDNMSLVTQRIKHDFSSSLKNGLARGDRSLTNYKRDFPLLVRGRELKFYREDNKYYIKWIHDITFEIVVGRKDKNKDELLYTLENIIINQENADINEGNKDYKVCDSSISIVDNKLILNLSLNIETKNKFDLIEGRVVGVDLGVKIPAYVSLNDCYYKRKPIGSYESFMKVYQQMKARESRVMKQISKAKGGKGRKRKLKARYDMKEKRSLYNRSYNHYLSKEIVKFALDNQAAQINLEFLTGDEFKKDKFLADWSYYELQTMIKYKAEKFGIKVKLIDPYHTSQICSRCGHYEEGQRLSQDKFSCKNVECGLEINADHNASQNIAKSTAYVTDIKETKFYKLNKEKEYAE